ncbi:alpha-glucosidase [Euzebyella marina]|uniref:Alpha-glucosidase n=2 Tax=Euzebyella marina TaxID=1761453 RepID=A0A3G2LBV6_9FLAO|nr:alpha-glucosidase [Euzebyella marina]
MSSGNKNSRWWKEGILYQIYPQSFKDSNGDGFGDLNGVIDKLDYLESLGITIVWMNPFYESPLIDNGYDVSDYRAILPRFGKMQDFEKMIKGMHKRGIKFVMDLVVNHSSEEHPWFKEAKKSRESPFYDYYHWWPAENGQPPYRHSLFDPNGAWEYVDTVNAYYLHTFTKHQPDLNWENPKLRKEIFDIMKFWANKGVDGYRLDAFQFVSKDITWPNFPEGHEKEYVKWYGMRPQLHGYLNEMYNEVLSKYDVFAVAEGTGNSFEDAHNLVDESRNELQMAYHFETINLSSTLARYSLFDFKQAFTKWDQSFTEEGWLAIFLANHDNARLVDRFGNPSERFRTVSTQLLNTFLMSMRGTPYLYYGDELGMTNIDMPHISDYDDIEAHGRYQAALKANADMNEFMNTLNYNSRENGRTPMQWDSSDHAGFTFGTPWKKVNPNYLNINVALQKKDPKSVLNHFRKMTRVRKTNLVLVYGKYDLLLPNHEQVYAFTRQMNDTKMLILLNFSEGEVLIELDELTGLSSKNCVINNYDDINIVSGSTTLQPYQATILKML